MWSPYLCTTSPPNTREVRKVCLSSHGRSCVFEPDTKLGIVLASGLGFAFSPWSVETHTTRQLCLIEDKLCLGRQLHELDNHMKTDNDTIQLLRLAMHGMLNS